MPQLSDHQKLLTALQEGQQALGLQIFLTILQTAIQEVNRDDTDDSDSQAGSPRADGLSSDVEMSSLSSHSTSTNTHSESKSGLSSDNMHHLSSDSDESQFAGLDNLDSVVDFYDLTTAMMKSQRPIFSMHAPLLLAIPKFTFSINGSSIIPIFSNTSYVYHLVSLLISWARFKIILPLEVIQTHPNFLFLSSLLFF